MVNDSLKARIRELERKANVYKFAIKALHEEMKALSSNLDRIEKDVEYLGSRD